MVMGSLTMDAELAVVGAGPGGYVAALRAAALGREVVLIEERPRLGGVCLLEGCIPSKTLIHAVELIHSAKDAKRYGITFEKPKLDLETLRSFTESVVSGLSKGVASLLKSRGVEVVHARARFSDPHTLALEGGEASAVHFKSAILATGSRIKPLTGMDGLGVWGSTQALALPSVPERLIVVGGGYIGLELGLVYAGLGSRVSLVEFYPRLLMGADTDLVEELIKSAGKRLERIAVESRVKKIEKTSAGFAVTIDKGGTEEALEAEQVLVAVGRNPNTDGIGLETIGLSLDKEGRLPVDERQRTRLEHIYAIGDITPGPMLAHKASREAKVAAEVISQQPSAFDNRSIPAVVYTDPELAWAGLTEREALESKRSVKIGRFPMKALGRARTLGQSDGFVKILADPESRLVLGVGIVAQHASELIAEASLALEMGATLDDLLVTIHPHPALSEAMMEAAEVAAGQGIHLP